PEAITRARLIGVKDLDRQVCGCIRVQSRIRCVSCRPENAISRSICGDAGRRTRINKCARSLRGSGAQPRVLEGECLDAVPNRAVVQGAVEVSGHSPNSSGDRAVHLLVTGSCRSVTFTPIGCVQQIEAAVLPRCDDEEMRLILRV